MQGVTTVAIEGGVTLLVEAWEIVADFQAMIRGKSLADMNPWLERASLKARKTDRGLAFEALSGTVQARAQGEIFRKHIGQDRGKKHRNADPEPRRVMDVPPVAPWGIQFGAVMVAISRHLNPFPPVAVVCASTARRSQR
jgi:hypothetical protein